MSLRSRECEILSSVLQFDPGGPDGFGTFQHQFLELIRPVDLQRGIPDPLQGFEMQIHLLPWEEGTAEGLTSNDPHGAITSKVHGKWCSKGIGCGPPKVPIEIVHCIDIELQEGDVPEFRVPDKMRKSVAAQGEYP